MRGERGSISIVTAAIVAVSLVIAAGASDVGRVLVAQAKARSAADSAALAAAQELAMPGGRAPAEVAGEYAARNGAELFACLCDLGGSEAVVEVRVLVGDLILVPGTRTIVVRARAVVDRPSSSPTPSPPPATA